MRNNDDSLQSGISLVYDIEETLINIECEEVKVYGLKIIQRQSGVTYTSKVIDITSKRDKIEELRERLMEKSIRYDGLLAEVEKFIANDLCVNKNTNAAQD